MNTLRHCCLHRLRDPPTPEMMRGTAVHAVLNDVYELPPQNRTLETMFGVFRDFWAKERVLPQNRHLFKGREAEKEWGLSALELLRNYLLLEDPAEREPLWREKRLFVEFGEQVSYQLPLKHSFNLCIYTFGECL
jgi:putative RecB family exonuclease